MIEFGIIIIFILLLWWCIIQLKIPNDIETPEYFFSPCQTCGPFKQKCVDKSNWDTEFVDLVITLIMDMCGKSKEYALCVIKQLQKHYSKDQFIKFIQENEEDHYIASVFDQYILSCKED